MPVSTAPSGAKAGAPRQRLCLLGGPFVVSAGRRLNVPEGSQRLVALLALRGRADRRSVAGHLWPDVREARAAGNLRSAVWRLKGAGLNLISAEPGSLVLVDRIDIDAHQISAWADRVIRGVHDEDDLVLQDREVNPDDLLPGWHEDWVIFERERLRQRILHALEAMSQRLREAGRHGEAVESAMCAVQLEPLRESAQRMLILAHLAEGNRVEAIRTLDDFARLLHREIGIEVTRDLNRLAHSQPTA